jgi:LacI family transcriptional regulator
MSITIKDLAKMLNVSHTTVSRSLNDSPLISRETKQRVKAIARKYNYTPNVSARSLVLSKSYNIGLFFSTLKTGTTSGFFLDAVRSINSYIKGRYKLAVEAIDDFKDFQSINKRNYDGILLMSQNPMDDSFIAHVISEEIPFVVINREIQGQKVASVLTDDLVGAYEATNYLLQCGHKKIGIILGKREFRSTHKRKEGFIKALSDGGIGLDERLIVEGDFDIESGYDGMTSLLKSGMQPTAMFCSNDDMAIGAMKAVFDFGLKVPGDISIMGFDDNGIAAYLSPGLTTVKRPIEKVSREGVKILLSKMEGKIFQDTEMINLPTKLMIRSSVAKIK